MASDSIPTIPLGGQIAVPTEHALPQRAQVVIAGAGMIGNSVACHLVQNGVKDIVIIDKGEVDITSGIGHLKDTLSGNNRLDNGRKALDQN